MSFVADALGFGGRPNAAGRGAESQIAFNQQGIDELRRQFGITQENIQPFVSAGQGQLAALQQGTTAGGLDQRLRELFNTDIFGGLVDERTRAVEGQLSAGGLTRSGTALQEAARIPTDIGLALERQLFGRSQNLAGAGQNAALGLGGLGAQSSGNIASILTGSGAASSQGILGDAVARAAQQQKKFDTFSSIGSAALDAFTSFSFFSDPTLKKNVEEIGSIGNLKLYQWDWVEKTKGTLIEMCPDIGFMADEVKEKFPQYVSEFCGFLVINYPSLLDELETANGYSCES